MTSNRPQTLKLAGFFNTNNSYPAFVIPVFTDGVSYYLQQADSTEIIVAFVPWDYEPYQSVLPAPAAAFTAANPFLVDVAQPHFISSEIETFDTDTSAVGESLNYAIADPPNVFVGDREFVTEQICQSPEFESAEPFFAMELSTFVGDRSWFNRQVTAAAELLFGNDPKQSEPWKHLLHLQFDREFQKVAVAVSLQAAWESASEESHSGLSHRRRPVGSGRKYEST